MFIQLNFAVTVVHSFDIIFTMFALVVLHPLDTAIIDFTFQCSVV